MLGLPKTTEVSRQLPKKAIYAKFNLNSQARDRFDADISRITIVNEISAATTSIAEGETVSAIYVMLVSMKKKDYDKKSVSSLPRLINQNMVLVLEFEGECRLAILHEKLFETDWQPTQETLLKLQGIDLDKVWENIVTQIGSITIEGDRTLEEQIDLDAKKLQIENEITKLERLARKEIQPKKKFELVQEINRLKEEIGTI